MDCSARMYSVEDFLKPLFHWSHCTLQQKGTGSERNLHPLCWYEIRFLQTIHTSSQDTCRKACVVKHLLLGNGFYQTVDYVLVDFQVDGK